MSSLMFVKTVQLFLLAFFLGIGGGGLKLSLSFLFSSLSSLLPHLPPGAAWWGLIRGKVKWAAHLCELPMPLPLSGAYLGPFVWARHPVPHFTSPFQTFPFHVIPSLVLFPLQGHLLHIPTPPNLSLSLSLSIPLSPAVTHSCSTGIGGGGGGREPESDQKRVREREIKNMRERKERREEGGRRASSLWECLLPAALWGETQQDYSLRPQLKPDLWKLSLRVRYLAQLGSHSSLAHPLIHAFFHEVPPLSFFSARSKSVLILHPSGFFFS